MNLKKAIREFVPFNEQEIKDKEFFLKCIESCEDILTRNNELFHFSASAFVINKDRNKILVVYHKIYDNWAFPGGHAAGDSELLHVALKEVKEETGLDAVPLSYREDESKGVKWIPIEEAYNKDIVDFIRPVNKKLIQKLGINITK